MRNLISMDFYRLSRSKLFIGSLIAILVMSFGFIFAEVALTNSLITFAGGEIPIAEVTFSSILESPFVTFAPLLILINVVSFSYLDLSGGYVKNIVGQTKRKTDLVVSKLFVILVMNLIFMIVACLGVFLGRLATGAVIFDDMILAGLGTFAVKWLLINAISALLLFFSNGLGNKVIGIILAVLLGTGALNLAYIGVNTGLDALGVHGVDITGYLPSSLLGSVSAVGGELVVNGIVSAVVVFSVFTALTLILFKKKDVK